MTAACGVLLLALSAQSSFVSEKDGAAYSRTVAPSIAKQINLARTFSYSDLITLCRLLTLIRKTFQEGQSHLPVEVPPLMMDEVDFKVTAPDSKTEEKEFVNQEKATQCGYQL
ncbi:hypothetical protein AVEN_165616-1, partial [Araneus ventricosus]